MKPLGLTVYPIVDRIPDGPGNITRIYGTEHGGVYDWQADRMAKAKRLTSAELAAEYWRAQNDFSFIAEGIIWGQMCGHWSYDEAEALARTKTLERFATMPHYDEEVTP